MQLSSADIQHIAELAKLTLTPDEIEQYRRQLSAILDHFETLRQVDTSSVPPTASVLPLRTVLRADVAHPGLSNAEALANAPDQAEGFFRVRAVFGQDE
ncbi:MAG: Asp-tRNA(Asn)/Glu-tRNA(Gln) amidotransferase subunit GatC [Caldilineales bacterium]